MLESLKNSNRTIGVKQSLKALENGTAKRIFIAMDAEEKVVLRIKELCASHSVEIIYVDTMKQLGKACGIDVGAAVAAVL